MKKRMLSQILSIIFFSILTACSTTNQLNGIPTPEMVKIPSGHLHTLACPENIKICEYDEREELFLHIDTFDISKTEVTFAQYDACVNDGGCQAPKSSWAYKNRPNNPPCKETDEVCQYPFDENWGRGEQPVIHVSWQDAQRYVEWLSKKTGHQYRLPKEIEWEYAAIANTDSYYYWGDDIEDNHSNCDGCGSQWDNQKTAPALSFEANPFGLHNMLGNVSEWVEDCLPGRIIPGKNINDRNCVSYIHKGGAWSFPADVIGADVVFEERPTFRGAHIGFRVAK